jgi:hypothetical protein
MLSVWRRLHIEVDSMGVSDGNYVLGTIPVGAKISAYGTATFTVSPSPSADLEVNRFEGGRLFTGRSFEVISNTINSVTVRNPLATTVSIPSGSQFQLYDDDDFNDDDGAMGDGTLDGDTGENITEPDMSLLTANSDQESTNVFVHAYVHPVYDIIDPRDDSIFAANTLSDNASDLRPLFVD